MEFAEVGTIHTHPGMGASWSGTDIQDQQGRYGVHIVLGLDNGRMARSECTLFTPTGYNDISIWDAVEKVNPAEDIPDYIEWIEKIQAGHKEQNKQFVLPVTGTAVTYPKEKPQRYTDLCASPWDWANDPDFLRKRRQYQESRQSFMGRVDWDKLDNPVPHKPQQRKRKKRIQRKLAKMALSVLDVLQNVLQAVLDQGQEDAAKEIVSTYLPADYDDFCKCVESLKGQDTALLVDAFEYLRDAMEYDAAELFDDALSDMICQGREDEVVEILDGALSSEQIMQLASSGRALPSLPQEEFNV
jgi:hypothetical protein